MDFNLFKQAVSRRFAEMQQLPLFRTTATKDELWTTYLGSFPEGSNPVYRERTEHDCNCCRQFVRSIGNVVAITPEGRRMSIWGGLVDDPNYQAVSNALEGLVLSKPIENVFLHTERTVGTDKNFEDTVNGIQTWNHFHVTLPPGVIVHKNSIDTQLGDRRTSYEMLKRALSEITLDALETVSELIDQKSLYRGDEHLFAVNMFLDLKQKFLGLPNHLEESFLWTTSLVAASSVCRIRNTSIGTLLVDLSIGRELDASVAAFEAKVAPSNYKRPTALVTKSMIDSAKKTVEELGLTSALERRYATINDITINNILFADRTTPKHLGGDPFADLATKGEVPKDLSKIEEMGIQPFLEHVLPKADSIEVMMDNNHTGNLVSLIAPVDPTAASLFKWPNKFSWSYNGEMADSIKERVKQAGGNVTGDLCCRLAWEYTDDLDFHMYEPGRDHIYFSNRGRPSINGGILDVDANGCNGMMAHPVENIFYKSLRTMRPGDYDLKVNNYSRRSGGIGFEVEIDLLGKVHHFSYDQVIRSGGTVDIATIRVHKAGDLEIIPHLPSTQSAKEVWGVKTNTFRKVNVVMMSPNFWDGQGVGNKHYFFMLDGCRNEGKARGFFNEFLIQDLDKHRKVIEMVGSKMLTTESEHQLSGLGFSSTQRNSILCRVKGSFNRTIKVLF